MWFVTQIWICITSWIQERLPHKIICAIRIYNYIQCTILEFMQIKKRTIMRRSYFFFPMVRNGEASLSTILIAFCCQIPRRILLIDLQVVLCLFYLVKYCFIFFFLTPSASSTIRCRRPLVVAACHYLHLPSATISR